MFKQIDYCRCCKEENSLFTYLDLGVQPLANSYHKNEGTLPRYPLTVNVCSRCYHSQLSVIVDPAEMFSHYLYVSGTTETFRKHCAELAETTVKKFSKANGLKVLDIACNDGTLLECFRSHGCQVHGVDPAANLRTLTEEKNIPVTVAFWGKGAAKKVRKKFDIITATNVFAHVDDVKDFLDECSLALKKDGVVAIEFPYAQDLISKLEFDTVYHEHLSYFLVSSVYSLVKLTDFYIADIKRTPIHGGSIRFYLKKGKLELACEETSRLIKEEEALGLYDLASYQMFSNQVMMDCYDFGHEVFRLRDQGYKLIGYGASAKGNTMLNYFDIKLDYIVDDNPMKWGYFTPGKDIEIKSPESLRDETKFVIVVLAWNFFEEIKKRVSKITDKNAGYLTYSPTKFEQC